MREDIFNRRYERVNRGLPLLGHAGGAGSQARGAARHPVLGVEDGDGVLQLARSLGEDRVGADWYRITLQVVMTP